MVVELIVGVVFLVLFALLMVWWDWDHRRLLREDMERRREMYEAHSRRHGG